MWSCGCSRVLSATTPPPPPHPPRGTPCCSCNSGSSTQTPRPCGPLAAELICAGPARPCHAYWPNVSIPLWLARRMFGTAHPSDRHLLTPRPPSLSPPATPTPPCSRAKPRLPFSTHQQGTAVLIGQIGKLPMTVQEVFNHSASPCPPRESLSVFLLSMPGPVGDVCPTADLTSTPNDMGRHSLFG